MGRQEVRFGTLGSLCSNKKQKSKDSHAGCNFYVNISKIVNFKAW